MFWPSALHTNSKQRPGTEGCGSVGSGETVSSPISQVTTLQSPGTCSVAIPDKNSGAHSPTALHVLTVHSFSFTQSMSAHGSTGTIPPAPEPPVPPLAPPPPAPPEPPAPSFSRGSPTPKIKLQAGAAKANTANSQPARYFIEPIRWDAERECRGLRVNSRPRRAAARDIAPSLTVTPADLSHPAGRASSGRRALSRRARHCAESHRHTGRSVASRRSGIERTEGLEPPGATLRRVSP